MHAVVNATADAKSFTAAIEEGAKSAPPDDPVHAAETTLPPSDATNGNWEIAICEDHVDHMLRPSHFWVDPKTGVVTEDPLAEHPSKVTTDPKLAQAVRDACK